MALSIQNVARPMRRETARGQFLPFHVPAIGTEEIAAVVEVLKTGWLTTGSKVKEFEKQFSQFVGARHAVAVNSATAALQPEAIHRRAKKEKYRNLGAFHSAAFASLLSRNARLSSRGFPNRFQVIRTHHFTTDLSQDDGR
jgi:DegT/DnrJ/EryC1/StrS aminotransferase family protein